MIDISAIGIFTLALLLSAGSPGPSIAALVSRVIACGWRDVLPFVSAMWIGELIWLSFAVLGLAAVAEQFQFAFLLIKYAGVIYLLYLAWGMWTAPVDMTDELDRSPIRLRNGRKMFLAGLSVTLGNPKIMVFYVALLPTLIDLGEVSIPLWLVLAGLTTIILASIDLSYMVLAARARILLKTPRALRVTNRISALTLGGAAGFIAAKS